MNKLKMYIMGSWFLGSKYLGAYVANSEEELYG